MAEVEACDVHACVNELRVEKGGKDTQGIVDRVVKVGGMNRSCSRRIEQAARKQKLQMGRREAAG
jgi:hypothetical protein